MAEMNPLARMWGTVRLVHPFPVSVVVLTSIVLLFVARGAYPGTSVLVRGAATVLACQVAVGSLNDFLDRDADRIYQPTKPIPSGIVSPDVAIWMTIASMAATAILAATFGLESCLLMLAATAGGLAYDLWLKPTAFGLVGYLVGFLGLFTWIWLVAGQLRGSFWLAYPAAGLVVIAAHLANSAPDIETDGAQGIRNLAVRLGPQRTVRAIFLLYSLSMIPAVLLVAIARTPVAAVLLFASVVLTAAAGVPAKSFAVSRPARVALFRLFAPAVGLFGVGCLLALKQLSA